MNPNDFNKMLELQAIIEEWEEDFDRNSQIEQIDNKYLQQIYNLIDTWREKDRETGISQTNLCPKCNGWGSVYNHREDSSIVYKCISCGKIFPPQEQASGGDSK